MATPKRKPSPKDRSKTSAKSGPRPEQARKPVPRGERRPAMMVSPPVPPPASSRRHEASSQRRQAILDAALAVFSANGFAAARLDEVAERAGVAKGTIYLFFEDKEDLFEQMVVGAVGPVLAKARSIVQAPDLSLDSALAHLFSLFRTEVLLTGRKDVALLVITEGARFPRIAAFYHREVISKMLGLVRGLAERAHAQGELRSGDLCRYPQLVMAPMLMSLIWENLFARSERLDVEGLLAAHRAILTGTPRRPHRRQK